MYCSGGAAAAGRIADGFPMVAVTNDVNCLADGALTHLRAVAGASGPL
jgi:hypothetical protein